MKRLCKIALNLDRRDWPNDYGYAFYLRSRSLCNYIERSLRKIDARAVDATKLCITGRSEGAAKFCINSSNIACLDVAFSPSMYDGLRTDDGFSEFMVQFLRSGLDLLPPDSAGDLDPILQLVDQFVEGGYLNRWQHKKRLFRDRGLKVALQCTMTTTAFELHLEVTNMDGAVFHRKILETDPDEIAFHYRFEDIHLEASDLVVSSKTVEPLCRIPLAEFASKT